MTPNHVNKLIVLFTSVAVLAVSAVVPASAQDSEPSGAKESPVETNMHEFMEYYFQPTYQQLRESMKAEPANRQAWRGVKAGALQLAEGGNLLLTRGPVDNRGEWEKQSAAVRDAGAEMYRAAKMSNYEDSSKHYRSMLNACNKCHQDYANGEHQLAP